MIRQDNHYVPGTYLKRWASSASRRVWVYRLLTYRTRTYPPGSKTRQALLHITPTSTLAQLQAAGLPCGPVHTLREALEHPQVEAMQWLKAVADFPGLSRPAPVPDLPLTLGASGGGIVRRPPLLGEHTDEILAGLGYSDEEIAALRAAAVI